MKSSLVSIIMPSYNNEKYIEQTIQSVLAQTYREWELLIVDDCSTDDTYKLAKKWSEFDKRIKIFKLEVNSGAAAARNVALKNAKGRFVTYLDSDDLWYSEKLKKQTDFMIKKNIGFSCISYEVISDDGLLKEKYVYMKEELDYKGFLKNNLLQTVGIMIDTSIIDKNLLQMPDIRRRQDAATWLQVLKEGHKCYGIHEILAQYRRSKGSLSSNRLKAVMGVWYMYRKIEKLSVPFSCYCFIRYAFLAVWKRVYI